MSERDPMAHATMTGFMAEMLASHLRMLMREGAPMTGAMMLDAFGFAQNDVRTAELQSAVHRALTAELGREPTRADIDAEVARAMDMQSQMARAIRERFAEGKPVTAAKIKQMMIEQVARMLPDEPDIDSKVTVERDPDDPSRLLVTLPPPAAELLERMRRRDARAIANGDIAHFTRKLGSGT